MAILLGGQDQALTRVRGPLGRGSRDV